MAFKAISYGDPGLGRKHQCLGCNGRFYDLGRTHPTCPKCGLEVAPRLEEPADVAAEVVPDALAEPMLEAGAPPRHVAQLGQEALG